jgi:hypothetical protein
VPLNLRLHVGNLEPERPAPPPLYNSAFKKGVFDQASFPQGRGIVGDAAARIRLTIESDGMHDRSASLPSRTYRVVPVGVEVGAGPGVVWTDRKEPSCR